LQGSDQRSPASKKEQTSGDRDANADVWQRLGVGPLKVVDYLQNLRMWISQTVLKRLVQEIEETNSKLIKLGMSDERIGKTDVEKLRRVAVQHHILLQVPSLHALIPFVEFHPNQKYLVQRFKELSDGGAMSDYKWSSGSNTIDGTWNADKHPSDAELVMSCLSAYLDTRLVQRVPFAGSSSSSKPFTGTYYQTLSQYLAEEARALAAGPDSKKKDDSAQATSSSTSGFLSKLSPDVRALVALSPQKSNSSAAATSGSGDGREENKDKANEPANAHLNPGATSGSRSCVIVQKSARPPTYELHLRNVKRVQMSGTPTSSKSKVDKIIVGSGRNNLFHTLLLFLHHVKQSEKGMLDGRIHFGRSGVNMLWVIEADE